MKNIYYIFLLLDNGSLELLFVVAATRSLKVRKNKKVMDKMFPISSKLLRVKKSLLSIPLIKLLSLSMGRISGLRNRVLIISNFFKLVLALNKNHGSDFTVRWLKSCYVALQKAQADDNLSSLRDLEPGLPLPRLINGLPSCIGSKDRHHIKKGHPAIIRFWSSLFSIYRILKCSYKLKTTTITNSFTGDFNRLREIEEDIIDGAYFGTLVGYDVWKKKFSLVPQTFVMSTSASPLSKIAWTGILAECQHFYSSESKVRENVESYLSIIKSAGFKRAEMLLDKIWEGKELGDRMIEQNFVPQFKDSANNPFGQFALKEEAAGKLRVFALVDVITQSTLKPLHDSMFSLLRLIPNDGTFDQTASCKRSSMKSLKAGCAYSFDLSAATDRLPSTLSAQIISKLFGIPMLGQAWRNLLVERDFYFTDKDATKYGLNSSGPYHYAVGQPMGALSSWPALALTHHFILQYSYSMIDPTLKIYRIGHWNEDYEILGDDLTIFNHDLASKYLEVCSWLGVDINITKSIVSRNKPVFEFAKRTYNTGIDVSPVPIKQLLSTSLGDRIGQFLDYNDKGMIPSISVLVRLISRFGGLKRSQKDLFNPVLAILGVLNSKGLIPHRWLVESVIAPSESFDLSSKDLKLPLLSSLKLILGINRELDKAKYPWSHEEIRKEIYNDYEDEFAFVTANRALTLAKKIEQQFDNLILSNVLLLFQESKPNSNLSLWNKIEDLGLRGALLGWFEENLTNWDPDLDISDLIEEIEEDKAFYYKHNLKLDTSRDWLSRAENLYFKFDLRPKTRSSTKDDSCKVLFELYKVAGKFSQSYWKIERASW